MSKTKKSWIILIVLSILSTWFLLHLHFSAAPIIGPMIIAIILALQGKQLTVSSRYLDIAQAITGCAIASNLEPHFFSNIIQYWWQMSLVVIFTLVCAMFVAFCLMKFSSLPGTTGAWGALPGASASMAPLADQYGGDGRIVAVMQYLRVGIVVSTTALVTQVFSIHHLSSSISTVSEPIHHPHWLLNLCIIFFVVSLSLIILKKIKMMAGSLLMPIIIGGTINLSGLIHFETPKLILFCSFTVIGWSVGLKFKREVSKLILKSAPTMLIAVTFMICSC